MKIRYDRDACQGHNRCYLLAPELFDVDDEGYAVLLVEGDVPAGAGAEGPPRCGQLPRVRDQPRGVTVPASAPAPDGRRAPVGQSGMVAVSGSTERSHVHNRIGSTRSSGWWFRPNDTARSPSTSKASDTESFVRRHHARGRGCGPSPRS